MTRFLIGFFALFFCVSSLVPAAVIRVPDDQPTIQAGINASVNGDTVLVAPGLYTGAGNTNIQFNNRQITLESETGAAACIIDCQGSADPGLQILNNGVVVRGLTITGGSDDGVVVWADTTLEDCVITGHGGHGLLADEGQLTLIGCTVSDNDQSGINAYSYADAIITGCTITGNFYSGFEGEGAVITDCEVTFNTDGGIFFHSGGTVIDSYITGNYALHMHGGGICSWGTCHLTNCRIIGNYASEVYGWGEGGGIWYVYGSPVITGCTISGNQADRSGGGIGTSENHMGRTGRRSAEAPLRAATISGNLITGNWAPNSVGGAIMCDGYGQMNLENNLIAGNISRHAAIYISSSYPMTIHGCSIAANQATGTSATVGGVYSFEQALTIQDSILWGNTSNGGYQAGSGSGTTTLSYTNVQGGTAGIFNLYSWGAGMIEADPLFVSGLDHNYYLGQVAAGQPADSPCLDVGSDLAANLCYTAPGATACLDTLTTRSDHLWNDVGQADLGFHLSLFPGEQTVAAAISCVPAFGTLPFAVQMGVGLTNLYPDQIRRLAARVDLLLASGQPFNRWRAGYTNVDPGTEHMVTWSQALPAFSSLVGDNQFTLRCWDVTPSPYNQPPYPPAGDGTADTCAVQAAGP